MKYCPKCKQNVKPYGYIKGRLVTELVLWLGALVLCIYTYFAVIPALAYSMWRVMTRTPVCPHCGNSVLFPKRRIVKKLVK